MDILASNNIWNKIFEGREVVIKQDKWNEEYAGLNISSGNFNFKSRLAKKTPKKAGYFVAIWKKDSLNKNIPFNEDDIGDYLVINILDDYNEGQFVFPVSILIEKGIVKADNSKGKMAFRVYPPWFKDLNKNATASQKWQTEHFYKMGEYNFDM